LAKHLLLQFFFDLPFKAEALGMVLFANIFDDFIIFFILECSFNFIVIMLIL